MKKISLPIKTVALWIVALTIMMETIDTSIINTAIPAMAKSLHVGPIDLKVALISYLISLAIFMPMSGWAADRFGLKRVFLITQGIFTLSSAGCALSHSLTMLVIMRLTQGFGGAFMLPLGRLFLTQIVPQKEYLTAINKVVMIALIGPSIGPVLGGVLTYHLSWHWIFWINVPIGICVLLGANHWLPQGSSTHKKTLDVIGFLLFGIGVASFTFGLSALSENALTLTETSIIFLVAVILLIAYGWYAWQGYSSLFNFKLFRLRTFCVSMVSNIICRLSISGIPFLFPLFLQTSLGYSAQAAGLLGASAPLGAIFGRRISLSTYKAIGFKQALLLNTIVVALAFIPFILVEPQTSQLLIVLFNFIYGIAASTLYTGFNAIGYTELTARDYSCYTTIWSVVQQIGSSIGVAYSAFWVTIFSQGRATRAGTSFLPAVDFHRTFIIMSLSALLALPIFLKLRREDGNKLM